jgi:hypothetical protein
MEDVTFCVQGTSISLHKVDIALNHTAIQVD